MSHLCSHSYTILRTEASVAWNSKWTCAMLTPIRCASNAFVYILPWGISKKKKSLSGGRSFTKIEHDSPQRPDTCLVCPQLKASWVGLVAPHSGLWSANTLVPAHPVDAHQHPVLFSRPGPHYKQFWLRKALRGERGWGRRGFSPALPFPFTGRSRQKVSRSWGLLRGLCSPLCLLPDGGAGAQGRREQPLGGQKVRTPGMFRQTVMVPPSRMTNPNLSLDLILIST